MNKLQNILLSILLIFSQLQLIGLPPINLFKPSDRFLLPDITPDTKFQFVIGSEHVTQVKGFQDRDNVFAITKDETHKSLKTNILEIYQERQKIHDKYKYIPNATLKIPASLLMSARLGLGNNVNLGFYLPYYRMELSNPYWGGTENGKEALNRFSKSNHLDIHGWKRQGIGDLVIEAQWIRNFPQNKPLLTNSRPQFRLGVSIPTGKKQEEDKILGIPFGNDGSWGVQFGGGLDVTFRYLIRGGLDVEFLYLFGNFRERRIKTKNFETDLLFPKKVHAYKEFGLCQQYNLYLETAVFYACSLKLNYQYLKQNESKLFLHNDRYNPRIVNNAESLQDWTAHSLIFGANFDYARINPCAPVLPAFLGWFKWGFNGKRALLVNSIGATFTVSF